MPPASSRTRRLPPCSETPADETGLRLATRPPGRDRDPVAAAPAWSGRVVKLPSRRAAQALLLVLIVPLAAYVVVSVVRGRLRPSEGARPRPVEAPPRGGSSEMKTFTFQQTREGKLLYRLR